MRIDPGLFILGASTGLAAAPAPVTPFAVFLEEASPAAPAGLLPVGARENAAVSAAESVGKLDAGRPANAYAFGAFGLFAPRREVEVERGLRQSPGAIASAPGTPPRGADPTEAGARAAEPGLAPACVASFGGTANRPQGVHERAAPSRVSRAATGVRVPHMAAPGEEPEAPEQAASDAGSRPLAAPPRPPAAPRLALVEADGRLSVIVGAADFAAADEAEARVRLAAAAAELGVGLDELWINGNAGRPPAGGARHGHRAR